MFRNMRRLKQEVGEEVCRKLLNTERRGVLSVIGDEGYPYAVPVDFYYDEAENRIYFHGAKAGHKIDAIRQCNKVCFTVWNDGELRDGDWAYYVTSVIVFGRASLPTEPELTYEKVRRLGLKYYPSVEEVDAEIERDLSRTQLLVLEIEHMSGKLVHEK